MSAFDAFTNLYSLSKTLRFELRPIGYTQKMLDYAHVFAKDELIQKKYEKTKPYFDRLHREFINEALSRATLTGLEDYFKVLQNWQKDKKNNVTKKLYEKKSQEIRTKIVELFDAKAKDWTNVQHAEVGLKSKNIEILFEEKVFSLLKARYGGEEESFIEVEEVNKEGKPQTNKISIFDSWKGFVGYFIKFFETRRNFYKTDGTATALATRIVDQNLKRFCDNLLLFENIKEKVGFREVGEAFGVQLVQIFSLDFYNQCLLQDGIDRYNKILGGEMLPNGEKIKGINEVINKYRQDHTDEKISFFKLLDKQILSEKMLFSDEIQEDTELFKILAKFAQTAKEKTTLIKNIFANFIEQNSEYDLSQIYLSREGFNTISRKWTHEIEIFEKHLYEAMKSEKIAKHVEKENTYKFPDFIPLSYIKMALQSGNFEGHFWKDKYFEIPGFKEKNLWEQFLSIFSFEFKSLFDWTVKVENGDEKKVGYSNFSKNLQALIQKELFVLSKDSKVTIKEFADSVLKIYQMAKYFAVEKKRVWLAEYELDSFYSHPEKGYLRFYENAYEDIVQVYNKLRNYLTKKPYSEQKWKLNFENPTLADGWDKNKESDNSAVILRKGGKYYLALMKGNNKIFDERFQGKFAEGIADGKYEKVVYKFFPDQAKMFPKVCFSAKGLEFFKPSQEILRIYKNVEFKKGEAFSLESMQKIIDFYKDCLTKYEGWACYTFEHLKPTKEYRENIGEFFRDVAEDGYKIDFQYISDKYIYEKNEKGEIYLFEIHNKDWNLDKARNGKLKTTQKNLHTLYFESVFSNENIAQNFPIKLNGQAEIFYRPKTCKDKLGTKKDNKGNEVIDHKRYNENKIFFHVPLTLNRTNNNFYQFNSHINNFLANNKDINIIGVDRGEKHLAYYSVINQQQEILESVSLNFIQNKDNEGEIILKNGKRIKEVRNAQKEIVDYCLIESGEKVDAEDYKLLLEYKEKKRKIQKQTWTEVENIKDLKKGYISQVVRKLADLAIKYNAIIVLEDLNMRFKQVRGGIEKSIYQQLEKALIDKLSFLVDKNEKDPEQAGHLLKAYQLAAPFETFQKMGKQTGIIFYTQASYTSKTDPVTGWRPHLYLKYSSAQKAKADIAKFSKIEFINDRFEFTYDIKNFYQAKKYPQKTTWTICSCVERYRWNRVLNQNKDGYEYYKDMTDKLIKLFTAFDINYSENISDQIKTLEPKGNEKFFKDFIYYISLICQIRNTDSSKTGDDSDFMLSPVEPFFDSRKENGNKLPKNGDDNGAYNIARKGVVILNKISDYSEKNGNCEKLSWGDLYVSDTDWDNFVAKG